MTEGLHHHHRRKRIHKKHEPYPHPDKMKNFMDKAIYLVGIFGPVMTVPQLLTIYIGQNASGVSPVTWGSYFIVAVFWVIYGVIHREKPIIFIYSIWIVLDILIVTGSLLYG